MESSFNKDEWEIVKARIEEMPSHIKMFIGGVDSLDKKQLLEHVKKKDEIGKLLVKMYFNYLRSFKKEAKVL